MEIKTPKFNAENPKINLDITVVHLSEKGIYGNTHFMFTDLNNIEVADEISAWLKSNWLN